jgi:hypothetical protein
MRERRTRITGLGALLATLALVTLSPLASAAPVRFGSNLSDDGSAGSTQSCPISTKTCTWILAEPYHRPNGIKAPKDGTIRRIRVIANKAGSFRPVLARIKNNGDTARVVRRGASISYLAKPDVIQVFVVRMTVKQGDVIGIEARKTSLLNCSGQHLPQYQPALPVGGAFRNATSDTGCTMMIEYQYG